VNVLKPHLRITIETLLERGVAQHEIARRTGVDRKTIRKYDRARANSPRVATGSAASSVQIPPPWPPALEPGESASACATNVSACEPHRPWIEVQVSLGRNAVSIYQDLVEQHDFTGAYNSVKRFVARLKQRAPERFDVLAYPPGEEAQVDYGLGALTRTASGKYRRPYLFVMTLKFSGKSFRKTVWKTSQRVWSGLHEEAFRAFGGAVAYVVLDNLKEGVIRPDIYAPELNALYAATLAHYGVIADPCRVGDPNRKGTVENAIGHTQSTALKGRRFESIEAQNTWLAHWEERWAAQRIHGRKKRQVMEMFREEQPHLRPLPAEGMRYFEQSARTVDDAGLVQVDRAYYAALPAAPGSEVIVRKYEHVVEILDLSGALLRRHSKLPRPGDYAMVRSDRLFNPSRETARLLGKAQRIGPNAARFAEELFARFGRPGQRAIYGLANLARHYTCEDIDAICARLSDAEIYSYAALKRALERRAERAASAPTKLTQSGSHIRSIAEYQTFWEIHSRSQSLEDTDGNVIH